MLLTSTETIRTIRDGEPRTSTSTFTQLLSSLGYLYISTLVEYCFASTETAGLLGTGAQDGYLDFYTAPELCISTVDHSSFLSAKPARQPSCQPSTSPRPPPSQALPPLASVPPGGKRISPLQWQADPWPNHLVSFGRELLSGCWHAAGTCLLCVVVSGRSRGLLAACCSAWRVGGHSRGTSGVR